MVKRRLNLNALASLHGAILLFALCALFGKWVDMNAQGIVFYRSLFACLSLVVFCLFSARSLRLEYPMVVKLFASGALLAIHWWSFFYTIQVSTVTLGLITFACFPVFVALLQVFFEPPPSLIKPLFIAVLSALGVTVSIWPSQSLVFQPDAIATGLLSALTFALLTLCNRQFSQRLSGTQIACYQNGFAALLLLPWVYNSTAWPELTTFAQLLLMGIIFTALAHTLLIHSLKQLNAFIASISINLEPIYGIFAAFILLNEPIDRYIILGAGLVISTSFIALKPAPRKEEDD
ncbi:DMT family transporter [Thalassotalea aquiviva]|uniref:DMT family transporter n=1 Tax=Thalassotalea aquiviva TaxID=3242415 RepID=UPI00352B22A8